MEMKMKMDAHNLRRPFSLIWVVTLIISALSSSCHSKCEFKAIFNFGDSNTDTGGFYAAFPAESGPFGMTYFGRPSGRASDGRLIVDFLAQALGIPHLSPYLQAIGSDFRHGANFATLASTVLLPKTSLFESGLSPFALPIQINQMKELKVRAEESRSSRKRGRIRISGGTKLPSPGIFKKSIYTFYIGQNDFTSDLAAAGIGGVQRHLPQVVDQIAASIKGLYALGGRTFLVLNLAPIGCYPSFLVGLPHNSSDLDEFGCMVSYNNAVVDYNILLKDALDQTRTSLPHSNLVYVDTHSVLLNLFRHPTDHGLKYGTKACCGYGGKAYNYDRRVYCGNTKEINGRTVTAAACDDPFNYVSWDGIHSTEAANKLTALAILNGSCFDPPFPLKEHCDLNTIG